VFDIRTATQFRIYGHKGNTGHKVFLAPNPPEGALIRYYLKAKPQAEVAITISDAAGRVVRELKGPKEVGINRANWDLRHEPPVPLEPGAGGGGFFGPPRGPLVPPGRYTVRVAVGADAATRTVVVEEDPRIQVSDADRKAWYEASQAAAKLWAQAESANGTAGTLKRQISDLQASLGRDARAPQAVTSAAAKLADKVDGLAKRLTRPEPLGVAGAALAEDPDPLLARARGLYGAIGGFTAAPAPQQRDLLARLTKEVGELVASLNAVIESDAPALNKLLLEHGIGKIDPGKRIQ
jgi:hypothetical protein